ncbi:MAG: (Fe-S)-binding protein, partial [Promethearchaeota archaeon]
MTETDKKDSTEPELTENSKLMEKLYTKDLRDMLRKCYQCARCSGVCQLSKVQKFTPSKIIQMILEGHEPEIIQSGVLWDCLTCNACLQNCPEGVNFADIVRNARYKMRVLEKQNPDDYLAHKGIYTTLSEIMSEPYVQPKRSLDWVPAGCEISTEGETLYFVGCLPYFNFEFENSNSIAESTLKMLCQLEEQPVVVLEDEVCCGHDLYWGQGKFEAFIKLAKKNKKNFEKAGVKNIITACAEGYRTLKVEYAKLFEDFNEKFKVQHIIEYIYENWKKNKIEFKNPEETEEIVNFTYHDPCRLSRFLPKGSKIIEQIREIFYHLNKIGFRFKEMAHNKNQALCCGVSSWINC